MVKGKKYVQISLTVTPEQAEYLKQQPNASELIRGILDNIIFSSKEIEDKLGVIALNKQLENLEKELVNLNRERNGYISDNKYKRWRTVKGSNGGIYIEWEGNNGMIPKPLDNEDGQIGIRVLQGYDNAIGSLEQRIAEIKRQILEF